MSYFMGYFIKLMKGFCFKLVLVCILEISKSYMLYFGYPCLCNTKVSTENLNCNETYLLINLVCLPLGSNIFIKHLSLSYLILEILKDYIINK